MSDEILTFMGIPGATDAKGARAAILGIPFECAGHRVRSGAHLGPDAIRRQSRLLRPYQPPHADFDPLTRTAVKDLGNLDVAGASIDPAFRSIAAGVGEIVQRGAIPVTLGGDGSVTLPQLRAVSRAHPRLALLHIDAHTDTGPGKEAGELSPSTTFTRAAEEGLIDLDHAVHVGARGTQRSKASFEFTREMGYEVITGDDLFRRGIDETGDHLRNRLAGRGIYLCFDMDFFDPSCAPGVCQPECGGPTAREGLNLIQSLAGLNFVAIDVNTVSPPQDIGDITALLAARVVLECLALVC